MQALVCARSRTLRARTRSDRGRPHASARCPCAGRAGRAPGPASSRLRTGCGGARAMARAVRVHRHAGRTGLPGIACCSGFQTHHLDDATRAGNIHTDPFDLHRDTWGSNLYAQINWWAPGWFRRISDGKNVLSELLDLEPLCPFAGQPEGSNARGQGQKIVLALNRIRSDVVADLIVTNGYVVTLNPDREIFSNGCGRDRRHPDRRGRSGRASARGAPRSPRHRCERHAGDPGDSSTHICIPRSICPMGWGTTSISTPGCTNGCIPTRLP